MLTIPMVAGMAERQVAPAATRQFPGALIRRRR